MRYTRRQFLNTTEPYDYLYGIRKDKSKLQRRLSDIRRPNSTPGAYCAQKASRKTRSARVQRIVFIAAPPHRFRQAIWKHSPAGGRHGFRCTQSHRQQRNRGKSVSARPSCFQSHRRHWCRTERLFCRIDHTVPKMYIRCVAYHHPNSGSQ